MLGLVERILLAIYVGWLLGTAAISRKRSRREQRATASP
jgi:hypothetical protein